VRTRLPLSLVTACLLTLSAGVVSAQTSAEARKSYDAAVQGAKRQFLKCDAEALGAGVTEDYTGVNFRGEVTKGRAAELKNQREFCAANTVTAWDATTEEFHSNGPLAWAAGVMSITYKPKATGKAESAKLRYLATYVHQPDGRWLQQYWMTTPMAAGKK